MAITILPQGETAGESFGAQLGSGIQNILNMKMQQMLQQKQQAENARGISALLGVAPEQAQLIAQTNPDILKAAIPQMLKAQAAAPQQQAYAQALQSILGGGRAEIPEGLTEHQATELAKIQLQKEETQAKLAEKAAEQKQKFTTQQQQQIEKKFAPTVKKIEERGEIADNALSVLDEMENILKSGQAQTGLIPSGAVKFGLEGGLNDATARLLQLQNKFVELLASDKVSGAKGVISKARLQSIQRAKMSLSQSPEVQLDIINEYKKEFEPLAKKAKIQEKILRDNEDKIPANLSSQINLEYGISNIVDSDDWQYVKDGSVLEDEDTGIRLKKDSKAPDGYRIIRKGK